MGTKVGNRPNWAEMVNGVGAGLGVTGDKLVQVSPCLPVSGYLATAPTPAWHAEAGLPQEEPPSVLL